MSKEIIECDERENCIHYKDSCGVEHWWEYDENNNTIYQKTIFDERWWEYDENSKKIHFRTSFGAEEWYKSDELNDQIRITEQEYKEIKFRKKEIKFLSREEISRFELMEL